MTESVVFLFFRRMRLPLIVLISAYAIATVGFTLVPGTDDQGNPWRMSLFQAFYVVSYTGSTIGFGEVPYEFSEAQRLWTMVSIYLTVIAWLFSVGSIVSLLQDPGFSRALRRARVARAVQALDRPFYLICGYGDIGRMLARALGARGHPIVIVEARREKIEALEVEDTVASVSAFAMDAMLPENLTKAGLRSRWCAGVIAVTGNDQANLKIAITAKLLNHQVTVHARANSHGVAANMRSFETDHVVNATDEYVRRFSLAIEKPDMFRLYHWMSSGPRARLLKPGRVPRGTWIVCGYNQVGRAVHDLLLERGMDVVVIDPEPNGEGRPKGTVSGSGTQAETLEQAGIKQAAGVVAATGDDADNLSILITARQLKPDLFLATLENGYSSRWLYQASGADFVGQPSVVVGGTILGYVASSLVEPFFQQMFDRDNDFARDLLARLLRHQSGRPPELTAARISARRSPAVAHALEQGIEITAGDLLRDPVGRNRRLPLELILLRREDRDLLCPGDDTALQIGDRLLLAGRRGAARRARTTLEDIHTLEYILTGEDRQHGWVWQWFSRRLGQRPGLFGAQPTAGNSTGE